VELPREPFFLEEGVDLVDPFGGDQAGPVGPFGNEVPQRPADRPGHPHDAARLGDEGELPVDLPHPGRVSGSDPLERLGRSHVQNHIGGWIDQIHQTLDRGDVVHEGHACRRGQRGKSGSTIAGRDHSPQTPEAAEESPGRQPSTTAESDARFTKEWR
jgi:hypothetical protein